MFSVCIADHVPLFLAGLRQALSEAEDIQSVIHGCTEEKILSVLEDKHPDVLAVSLDLPPDGGLDLVHVLWRRGWRIPTLLYGKWSSLTQVNIARHFQVLGMCDVCDTPAEFLHVIRRVARGRQHISPGVQHILHREKMQRSTSCEFEHLTGAELEVLSLLAGNRTSRQIADVLCISERTVQKHRQNIGRKLSLRGCHALLTYAVHHADILQLPAIGRYR